MRIFTFLPTVAILLFLLISADVAAQSKISVQGVIRKSDGNAVDDGNYSIVFKLYNVQTGGTALWTETQPSLNVTSGIYSAVLGSVTPLTLSFNEYYYLSLTINGEEMQPRAALSSAPYTTSLIGESNEFPSNGNVGVGTTDPTAKLHVDAKGLTTEIMRISNDKNTTKDSVMVMTANGYIGIGTTSPTAKVEVKDLVAGNLDMFVTGSASQAQIRTYDNNVSWPVNLRGGAAFLCSSPTGALNLGTYGTGNVNIYSNNAFAAPPLSVTSAGRVGIGTTAPSNRFHVVIPQASGDYVYFQNTTSGEATIRLGSAGSPDAFMGLNAWGSSGSGVFGIGNAGARAIAVNLANNRVGINVSTPAYTLHVGNGSQYNFGSAGVLQNVGGSPAVHNSTNNNINVSIATDGGVAAPNFYAFSDERIKKNKNRSDLANDLQLLKQLKVTDYQYIDEIAMGPRTVKGLIAQQLKVIMPDAVSLQTQVIPNLYTRPIKTEINDKGNLVLTLDKDHDLKAGDKIKLYTDKAEYFNVVQTKDATCFEIAGKPADVKNIFLYGKEINDFHVVDYDQVFSVGLGAIQQLSKEVDQLQSKITLLEKENAKLKKSVESQNQTSEAQTRVLEARLEAMENQMKVIMQYQSAGKN